ncbi:ATP-binding cassette domain-containing protein [Mycoplasma sp. T363T]|uniref:ATP-binding cassette domain-containing protein n=1 Tax=Mycoplasma bradburyae TaxID=2963128 RepID=A0AAW6HNZ6_9MOLU|nr:ATP-binding cassette domain-containing protein [Mycoplasma bradburyae]MDC4163515.1 ATP-binding cassette domain-containing protein [Mycoplasma bradburyae]MDC4182114.1 ATP-binding cassette domain-containing protein [Mycoplasma bradburyae]MDC4183562.1 ATP-binding cassette domain-containing protein [Mycoplasma bradburyae]UTS70317.1 ATP-binding cassette domain-containing protein [Mycoplasma bradburyae]UTS71040.1 ATP-binding cassette domain-containing protein [Mycoplasma bradburyae]
MDKTNYIKFSGVSIKHKKYKDFSVDNINFELYGSEVLMLIGKSGAGKTTLLNSITNNKLVSNGQIIFNDQNLLSLNKNKIRKISRSFGFLDQVPNLILEDYVYENITRNIKKKWWCQIFNFTPLSVLNKVEQVLAKLGLSDHINKLVKDLSGGQKQRVEIAKIFFQKPKLLIIDEPTTGLDYLNSEIVIKEIIALSKEFNAPVIISIHDLEIVKKFAHKILIIQNKTANLISNSDDLNIEEIKRKYDTE